MRLNSSLVMTSLISGELLYIVKDDDEQQRKKRYLAKTWVIDNDFTFFSRNRLEWPYKGITYAPQPFAPPAYAKISS